MWKAKIKVLKKNISFLSNILLKRIKKNKVIFLKTNGVVNLKTRVTLVVSTKVVPSQSPLSALEGSGLTSMPLYIQKTTTPLTCMCYKVAFEFCLFNFIKIQECLYRIKNCSKCHF